MAENNEALSTPTDQPTAAPRRVPQRGTRKRVVGQGEGDYLIYELVGPDSGLPKGSLVPIPEVPQFADTQKALQWIRNKSGDLLHGKQVIIFRVCEILALTIQAKPTVVIQAKGKVTVNKPAANEENPSDG